MENINNDDIYLKKAETFKILSNPVRLKIIALLLEKELCVCEMHEFLPNITQPAISQHLNLLRREGFLKFNKRGQHIFYTLSHEKLSSIVFDFKLLFKLTD